MNKIIAFLLLVLSSSNAYAIAEPVQMGYLNGTGQFLPYTSSNPLPLSVSASTGITGTLPVANGGTAGNGTVNAQTGTAYTTVLGDAGNLITMNNAAASTLTIPQNSSVAYPLGTVLCFEQIGAGAVTLTAGTGTTFDSNANCSAPTAPVSVSGTLMCVTQRVANTWAISGACQ